MIVERLNIEQESQLVSDLGAVSGFAYFPLAGNTTSTRMTGGVYFTNLVPIYWRNFANTANTFGNVK